MIMCLNVLKVLNIFMNNTHHKDMKILISSILYLLLCSFFIGTKYLNYTLFLSIILFIFFCIIIQQYYVVNYKIIELKDFIFCICFNILLNCIYILFNFDLNFDEIIISFTISFISIIFYTCQLRNV